MGKKVIDRFVEYMKYANLNDNQVTVQAGLSNAIIGKAKKDTHDLSAGNISKLLYAYKDLDARWLLTGEGEMLVRDDIATSNNVESSSVLDIINKMLELQTELTRLEDENKALKQMLGISKAG